MHVLLLSVGTETEYSETTRAVAEELTRRGMTWEYRDCTRFFSPLNARLTAVQRSRPYRRGAALRRQAAMELRLHMEQGEYDAVVCTHGFAALILSEAIKQEPFRAVTFYLPEPSLRRPHWECGGMDFILLPWPDLRPKFQKRGIPEKKLLRGSSAPHRCAGLLCDALAKHTP